MSEVSGFRRFLALLRSNWLSRSGAVLTTISFLAMITLFLAQGIGLWNGPYAGLVTFLVLPGLFVLGLLVIPLGLFLYRRRARERIQVLVTRPLPLLRIIGILTIINIVVASTAGYQGLHYMDSVEFCGTLCHRVMEPQYRAYLDSPHARVACVDCHIGTGASWFVKSKLSGVRQVFAVLFDTYERPIPTPVKNLRPARETCEQCHWPEKFTSDRLVVRRRFRPDRGNTETTSVLVMKTGGVRPDGTATGIHWHVHQGIEVTYVATDEQRREIPWVRLLDKETGEAVIYTVPGTDPDRPPPGEVRTMDCVDCHNQPSHIYQRAADALDRALAAGTISPRLPWIKKIGLEVLKEARTAEEIPGAVRRRYAEEGPLPEEVRPLLAPAVRALVEIHRRNVHPEMSIGWDTYRSFTGHFGCRRCHDDRHSSREGRVIPVDCRTCHVTLAYREENPKILDELGIREPPR